MKRILLSLVLLFALSPLAPVQAGDGVLYIAADHLEGYDRSLFKHWIDADKNGCDTRKEVLIAEAIVKPKIGKKCALTGGKWLSSFDGKTHTKDSGLDVDHLVPLKFAWDHGAWAWETDKMERFANDPINLVITSKSLNRSKGSDGPLSWLPPNTAFKCAYLKSFLAVMERYLLVLLDDESQKFQVLRNDVCNGN